MTVRCPDCGEMIELTQAPRAGDLAECRNCAGHLLRLREERGEWSATLAHRVSCPDCDELLTLPEGSVTDDLIECCGRRYRLTFEYGAFAAEPL
jgi:predicted RNA-binding Zn-ribbon protein involved in translation (DUF1610 family)